MLLGSPVYFGDVTAEMKAIIDRAGTVGRKNGNVWARKPGAAVVAVRRAGAMHAFDTINHFFLIGEMLVVGSSYWNIGIGRNKGEVEADDEGMAHDAAPRREHGVAAREARGRVGRPRG